MFGFDLEAVTKTAGDLDARVKVIEESLAALLIIADQNALALQRIEKALEAKT
jgi:hypothetical protein